MLFRTDYSPLGHLSGQSLPSEVACGAKCCRDDDSTPNHLEVLLATHPPNPPPTGRPFYGFGRSFGDGAREQEIIQIGARSKGRSATHAAQVYSLRRAP